VNEALLVIILVFVVIITVSFFILLHFVGLNKKEIFSLGDLKNFSFPF
jgi:hypothetical protein